MKKEIELGDKKISVTFRKSSRARMARLAVRCDGNVIATVPENISENIIEEFIKKKAAWIIAKVAYFKQHKILPTIDYPQGKKQALQLIKDRIGYYNKIYNFSFNKISVKNQRTRWGSCSKKKNLNFNYKIISLPKEMSDYIIVHELCHLKELNHSQNFWNLVAETIPDHKSIRKGLKNKRI